MQDNLRIEKTGYWLDNKYNICSVSDSWDTFAMENDGDSFVSEKVLGKSIWSFISDDATRMWFDTLIQKVKLLNRQIERHYRCDSDKWRRYMKMVITPGKNGLVKTQHLLLDTTPRNPFIKIEPIDFYKDDYFIRCSICGRLQKNGKWYEPELLFSGSTLCAACKVIYDVCSDCKMNKATE